MPSERIPNFKQSVISKEQMGDFVKRVNAYRNGARNIYYSEQDIRNKINGILRASASAGISMTVEEAIGQIIVDRNLSVDALNNLAA